MNNKLIKNLLQIYKKNKIKLIQMYGAAEATARMSYLKYEFAKRKLEVLASLYQVENFK